MTHSIVHIKASPKQLSKLRNGHKVRISPPIEGEGFNLIVDPSKFNTISRAFEKSKGVEIQLSPEEIMANKSLSPEEHQKIKAENQSMAGQGIFGKKFDRFVRKVIGKKAKDVLYRGADRFVKPVLKTGLDIVGNNAPELLQAGLSGLAVASGNPELVPIAGMLGKQLGSKISTKQTNIAKRFLDKPKSNVGGPINKIAPRTLSGQVEQNKLLESANKDLGTNMGYMGQAGVDNLLANEMTASNDVKRVLGRGFKREVSSVGRHSGFVGAQTHLPPALQSQPFSANFQFQHFLPPAYQKFSKGAGLYL